MFKRAFSNFGSISTGRAKYLLSQLEKQYRISLGGSGDAQPDWSGKSVSVEHIFAESSDRDRFSSDKDYERFQVTVNSIANYTLLERTLNRGLGDAEFSAKKRSYAESKFPLTQALAQSDDWSFAGADVRLTQLSDLAIRAWPSH